MIVELQTIAVVAVVVAAGFYVLRNLIPGKHEQKGCSACPQNPRRGDDYT